MLEMRPVCEHCGKALPNESEEAMICTYECTFCQTCVEEVLQNVCPNCTGGFAPRPTRPKAQLTKYPTSSDPLHRPVDLERQQALIKKWKEIPHRER